jgi:hypothetical protein
MLAVKNSTKRDVRVMGRVLVVSVVDLARRGFL